MFLDLSRASGDFTICGCWDQRAVLVLDAAKERFYLLTACPRHASRALRCCWNWRVALAVFRHAQQLKSRRFDNTFVIAYWWTVLPAPLLVYVIEITCSTIWLDPPGFRRSLRNVGYTYQTVSPCVILEAVHTLIRSGNETNCNLEAAESSICLSCVIA